MPPTWKSHTRAGRMRYLFAVLNAPNCCDQAEGHRRAWRRRGQESSCDQRTDVRTSWTLLRFHALGRAQQRPELARSKAGRHLSPSLPAARSAPEKRSLERSADGDEIPGPQAPAKRKCVGTDAFVRPAGKARV